MNILVSGANGYLGHTLIDVLKEIRDGIFCLGDGLKVDEIYACDEQTPLSEIEDACANADFVFNVSRYSNPDVLIENLARHKNTCPVMLGCESENNMLFHEYGRANGVNVLECNPGADMELLSVDAIVYDMISAMQSA